MGSNSLIVFSVDDDEDELELLSRVLEEIPDIDVEIHEYTDPELALTEFTISDADLIFLDYQLGEMTAVDFLKKVRRIGDQRPAIVLTGRGDEYAAAELTRAGADDYIIKGDLDVDVCRNAIDRGLEAHAKRLSEAEVVKSAFKLERANNELERAKRELEETNSQLRDISDSDPITSLPNRRGFVAECERRLASSERDNATLSLALLDIDRFSELCDRHGKLVGEQVLAKAAHTLKQNLRQCDIIARLDGETFGILFPETELEDAVIVANLCRKAAACMAISLEPDGAQIGVTVSAGVACNAVGSIEKLEPLIQAADTALRRAKKAGGNLVR